MNRAMLLMVLPLLLSFSYASVPFVDDYLYYEEETGDWVVRCQSPIDNHAFDYESAWVTYFGGTSGSTGYPEWSQVGFFNFTSPNIAYYVQRVDVLFKGNFSGCLNAEEVCRNGAYAGIESQKGGENSCFYGGYVWNSTDYNAQAYNKTAGQTSTMFEVCGDGDEGDTNRTMDIMYRTENAFALEPIDLADWGFGSMQMTWLPHYVYQVYWDGINDNITDWYEIRLQDLRDYLGNPSYAQFWDRYNDTWNVDRDFILLTHFLYRNNHTETTCPVANSSYSYWGEHYTFPNGTWYGPDNILDYGFLWDVGDWREGNYLENFFWFDTSLYGYAHYYSYDSLAGNEGFPNRPITIGCGLNFLETGIAGRTSVANNLTIQKAEYYEVVEYPFKYEYRFTRELTPLLEPANHVSIVVPIALNMTGNYYEYENLNGTLEHLKVGNDVYLTERVSAENPTWSNSAENYTAIVGVCKSGMYYYEGDCYNSATFWAVLGNQNQGLISGILAIGLIAFMTYNFIKRKKR